MTIESEKLESCAACGNERKVMRFSKEDKLRDVVEYLKTDGDLWVICTKIVRGFNFLH